MISQQSKLNQSKLKQDKLNQSDAVSAWPPSVLPRDVWGRSLADAEVERQLLEPHARVLAVGVGRRFVEQLEQAGHRVIWVESDERQVRCDAAGLSLADRAARKLMRVWLARQLSPHDARCLASAASLATQDVLLDQCEKLRWIGTPSDSLPQWWRSLRARAARGVLGQNPVISHLLRPRAAASSAAKNSDPESPDVQDMDAQGPTRDAKHEPTVADPTQWLHKTLLSFDLVTLGNLPDAMTPEAGQELLAAAQARLAPRGRIVVRSLHAADDDTGSAWAATDRGLIWQHLAITRPPLPHGAHTNRVVPRRRVLSSDAPPRRPSRPRRAWPITERLPARDRRDLLCLPNPASVRTRAAAFPVQTTPPGCIPLPATPDAPDRAA